LKKIWFDRGLGLQSFVYEGLMNMF